MRIEFGLFLVLTLTGCQSTPPAEVEKPALPAVAPSLDWQERTLRQQQQIRALIAQNDALHARVRELETPAPAAPHVPGLIAEARSPEPAPRTVATTEEEVGVLAPNAEGVIDLVAVILANTENAEANPFAVRSVPADAVREVALHVSGLVQGDSPFALVNGRTVAPGEAVESFTLVRIEPAAAVVRHGTHRLRLPVSETPVRIRLPL